MYIRRKDVERHGYTEGCEGCRAVSRGGVSRNHTEACRQRIEKAIREEGEGNRAQQQEDRTNKILWKEIERQEKEAEAKKVREQQEREDRKRKEEEGRQEEDGKRQKEAEEE